MQFPVPATSLNDPGGHASHQCGVERPEDVVEQTSGARLARRRARGLGERPRGAGETRVHTGDGRELPTRTRRTKRRRRASEPRDVYGDTLLHAVAFSSSAVRPRGANCTPAYAYSISSSSSASIPHRRRRRPHLRAARRGRRVVLHHQRVERSAAPVVGLASAGGHARQASAELGMPSNLPKKLGGHGLDTPPRPSSALAEAMARGSARTPSRLARWRSVGGAAGGAPVAPRWRRRAALAGARRARRAPAGLALGERADAARQARGHARVRRDEPRRAHATLRGAGRRRTRTRRDTAGTPRRRLLFLWAKTRSRATGRPRWRRRRSGTYGAHLAHCVVAFAAANARRARRALLRARAPPRTRGTSRARAAHAVCVSTAAKVPGAHASQTEAPGAPATRPRGHTTQVSAEASSVNVPAGHVTHAPVARSRRVPGRHARRTATVNPSPAAALAHLRQPVHELRQRRASTSRRWRPRLAHGPAPAVRAVADGVQIEGAGGGLGEAVGVGPGGVVGSTLAMSARNVACECATPPVPSGASRSRSKIRSNAPAGSSSVSMRSNDRARRRALV